MRPQWNSLYQNENYQKVAFNVFTVSSIGLLLFKQTQTAVITIITMRVAYFSENKVIYLLFGQKY